MTVRLWLELSHNPALRIAGWALVRGEPGAATALAGGDRGLDEEQAPQAAIAFALKAAGPGAAIEIVTTSPALQASGDSRISPAPPADGRSAFAAAWAEFGRDKARSTGPFTAPVPKSNLVKAGL